MDMKQLRFFVGIVEAGSLAKAADRLFVAQTSLSEHVKALEEITETKLLNRHARGVRVTEAGEKFQPKDLLLQPGDRIELAEVGFTAACYGPVLVAIVWEAGWKEPLLLVSNLDFLPEAYGWYKRRFRIETFFSDQKSRGFYLGHSHISDTKHLDRLLIGTCLAYLWMVCLGAWVLQTGKLAWIHRADRCDWSLFRIGMAWIEFCLNEGLPIWIQFALSEQRSPKSVG